MISTTNFWQNFIKYFGAAAICMSKIDHFLRPPQKWRWPQEGDDLKNEDDSKVILPKDGRCPEVVCNLYGRHLKYEKTRNKNHEWKIIFKINN